MKIALAFAAIVGLLTAVPYASASSRRCWHADARVAGALVNYAEIENPSRNFTVLQGWRRFGEVKRAGVVVTNGTFFEEGQGPIGPIIKQSHLIHGTPSIMSMGDGRMVDVNERWGIGVRMDGRMAVVRDAAARSSMTTFLGGAGILLLKGAYKTALNWGKPGVPGPNFPEEFRTRRTAHTALGIKIKGKHQVLLIVNVPPWSGTTIRELARVMKALGASDAVFYDGGGATAFAAGPRHGPREIDVRPMNPGEDLNPTHIVVPACR